MRIKSFTIDDMRFAYENGFLDGLEDGTLDHDPTIPSRYAYKFVCTQEELDENAYLPPDRVERFDEWIERAYVRKTPNL